MSALSKIRRRVASAIAGKGNMVIRRSRITGEQHNTAARQVNRRVADLPVTETGLAFAIAASVWAYRCMDIRARTIARMPWYVKRVGQDKKLTAGTPFHRALDYAYSEYAQNLIYNHEMGLTVWGETYLEKLYIPNTSIPGGLRWINNVPLNKEVMYGNVLYYEYDNDGDMIRFETDELFVNRYENPASRLDGLSPLGVGLSAVNIDRKTIGFISRFYDNDTTPGGVLTLKPGIEIDEEEETRIIAQWKAQLEGVDKNYAVILMPHGLDYTQYEANPPDAHIELSKDQRATICAAMNVPPSMALADMPDDPLSANSTMDKSTANFIEFWAVPETEDILKFYNTNVMPWLAPGYELGCDFDKVLGAIRDTSARADMVNADLATGGITLAEWRKERGYDALDGLDLHVINGVPVPRSELPNYWRHQLPIAPITQLPAGDDQQPTGQLPEPRTVPALQPGFFIPQAARSSAKASEGTPGATIIARFRDTSQIMAVINTLVDRGEGGERMRWTAREDLHLTLVHTYLIDQVEMLAAFDTARSGFVPIPISVEGIDVFDHNDEYNVLMLRVKRDANLNVLQRRAYESFAEYGVPISEYSVPDDWQPHITLAYVDKDVPLPDDYAPQFDLVIDQLDLSRTAYRSEAASASTILESGKAVMLDELDTWQKFELNRFGRKSRPFEPSTLPESFIFDVRAELAHAEDKATVRAIFGAAREALQDVTVKIKDRLWAAKTAQVTEDALAGVLERFNELGMTELIEQAEVISDDTISE